MEVLCALPTTLASLCLVQIRCDSLDICRRVKGKLFTRCVRKIHKQSTGVTVCDDEDIKVLCNDMRQGQR
jgi:hypothetical protein